MGQKVCLDTDFVISVLNNENRASELIKDIESLEIFVSVVTLFELFQRETNLEQIEIFRNKVKILNLDELAARKAASVFKNLRKEGRIIEFRDIFIASTCIINNCRLATFNKKHFENIRELKLI